eukprot:g65261.t1
MQKGPAENVSQSRDTPTPGVLNTHPSIMMDAYRFRLRSIKQHRFVCSPLIKRLRRIGLPLYYFMHLGYFLTIGFVGSIIIYANERDNEINGPLKYIDALFLSISGSCLAGLSTVDMSLLKQSTLYIVMIWIQLGGMVFSTMPMLLIRSRLLQYAQEDIIAEVGVATCDVHVHNYFCSLGIGPQERKHIHEMRDIEGAAVGFLLKFIIAYQVVVELVVALWIGAYMSTGGRQAMLATTDGRLLDPWFFGFFVSISAFCNAGFTPLPDSLMRFAAHPMVLVPTAINIFLGATAYPLVLRALIRWSSKLFLYWDVNSTVLCNFLLLKSRTVYTHLFSASYSQLLRLVWTAIYLSQLIMFYVSEFQNYGINEPLSNVHTTGQFVLAGFFNSASTRTAGFNAIDTNALTPGMQLILLLYLCISEDI